MLPMSTTTLWLLWCGCCCVGPLALAFTENRGEARTTLSDEKKLIKQLLDNYEKVGVVGRPVYNTSQTIEVFYGLSLIQILDLDEKNQVLTTNVWSKYRWNDLLLRWDPKDFGGIELVRVPSSKIWTPDIVLYNYADIRLKEHRDAMVLVNNNGTVDWLPQAIFKSTCNIDITNFPFDIQVCKMKFGSWTYDGYKLDVNFLDDKDEFEISDYVRSNEWELLDSRAKKNVKYYYGLIEPYPDLTFFVIIRRVAVFYNYILVLPCVLLSFLTLVIFWLPPESPAKVMLGMSVFVAFFVLLLLLADSTPPAACSIPLIGAYFCANMILITLSTFLAVIIIQNHVRGDRKNKVPAWLKMIAIDGMARVLCMSEFLEKEQQKQSSSSSSTAASTSATTQQPQRSSKKFQAAAPLSSVAATSGKETAGLYMHQSAMVPPLRTHTDQPIIGGLATGGRRSVFKPYISSEEAVLTGNKPSYYSSTLYPQHHHQQQQQQQQLLYPQPPLSDQHYPQNYQQLPAQQQFYSQQQYQHQTQNIDSANISTLPNNVSSSNDTSHQNANQIYMVGCSAVLENDVKEIRKMLKAYITRLDNKDTSAKYAKEWRLVARVLDRIFFYAYIGTIIVSLCTIFPRDIVDIQPLLDVINKTETTNNETGKKRC